MANRSLKKWVSLAAILVLAAAAAGWGVLRWRRGQLFVSTDDAYVRGHVVLVASRVPGPLSSVAVRENDAVKAGQLLATVDPRDYDAALAKALASVSEAENGLALGEAQLAQARAQLRAVESQQRLAEVERARLAALFERQSIPRQKLDQVITAAEVASAQVTALRKQVAAAEAGCGVGRSKVALARASAEQARLQRSYCTLLAPSDGYVGAKQAEPGMVVAPGQPLLAVVPLDRGELWVEANFKETQLRDVRPGQKVRLRADIERGRVFTGVVDSLSAGTGSVFSLLPAENATGNWVKVVQRVPVKIRLDPASDPGHRLRLGLSVSAEIDTRGD